ncbi:hypothetical protein N7478_011683 [Penicillium angulare]|uniref:uncharacterized protein n=1 Tax=Penicillium angulare TaxID=116970 RepID=UPI0025400C5D|nr:uncharacterized protein N7478_011683 [Penicillium angulare]KAJ5261088.1 hypothetical protein N7478_011683 [Penicillium angulare]
MANQRLDPKGLDPDGVRQVNEFLDAAGPGAVEVMLKAAQSVKTNRAESKAAKQNEKKKHRVEEKATLLNIPMNASMTVAYPVIRRPTHPTRPKHPANQNHLIGPKHPARIITFWAAMGNNVERQKVDGVWVELAELATPMINVRRLRF